MANSFKDLPIAAVRLDAIAEPLELTGTKR
jgi:hypothetical protein